MPVVSVIIPSYNLGRFLLAAVESVLRQTYRDFELIVIDDGSTDNTPELARTFPAEVRYIRQENRGLSAVRNRGIELARGRYIIFLDADDVLLEKALEISVDFMDRHPGACLCHGQSYTMDEAGMPLRLSRARGPRSTFLRDGKEEIKYLIVVDPRNVITPSSALIRRACFDRAGLFNTGLRMSEDVDMWIRMAKISSIGHLAEPVVVARSHGQSITARSSVEVVKNAHTIVIESLFQDPEFGPLYHHLKNKAYFGLYCLLARVAGRTGHHFMAIVYSLKAAKTYPRLFVSARSLSLWLRSANDFVPPRLRQWIIKTLMALRLR